MRDSRARACGIALLPFTVLLLANCAACASRSPTRPKVDIKVGFDPTQATPLCALMEKLGSDKGNASGRGRHDYTTYYSALFARVRNEPLRIFEMGIGTNDVTIPSNMGAAGRPGASLRAWRTYFPRARVFGADIDKKILFKEDRIETFFCDMTQPEVIAAMWKEPALSDPFDFMVDDGLHVFEAQVTLLEHSLHKLAKGGVYVVEDVIGQNIPRFEAKIRQWKERFASFDLASRIIRIPNERNTEDNNLVVLQRKR